MKYEGGKRLRRAGESRVTGGEGLKGKWGKQSWLFAGIGELLDHAVLKKKLEVRRKKYEAIGKRILS